MVKMFLYNERRKRRKLIFLWVMLTSVLRALVKNSVKKVFMGKEKKTFNVLIAFFISHKSDVKIFFN